MNKDYMYHNPVLLNESIEGLRIVPEGTYVDVTFGGGGHSREILSRLTTGKLIAFDKDPDAKNNLIRDERFLFVNNNFSYLTNFLKLYHDEPVDGILADLGVSSHQFDVGERGFSTRFDAPLDMRMNQSSSVTAEEIVNGYSESQLNTILKEYGELKNSYYITRGILKAREQKRITTTTELTEVVKQYFPAHKLNKYLAMVFQALRIEVNDELGALKTLLEDGFKSLKPGGRFVVISYHSLEDRLVKNFFKSGNFEGHLEKDFFGNVLVDMINITGRPLIPSTEEMEKNPRARSAKLRIAEKK
ncbi:MAG: 16S rRNA (cytosine(1402)-N(4))-methyltransferase [Bacteroidetes bacterium GWF2_41_31]|nr:MAG: 16S rRNA (cytosine(1402)-N(4))-methyltransferase [Bacteroidetes bacterium GWF2_41_31]OFZ08706.1 MAG: 16S rRNA (cytosine(1402)-N(4))-methyltransferase [Bacteroidetes bacterium RIFOXYB12_FULL_41_6]